MSSTRAQATPKLPQVGTRLSAKVSLARACKSFIGRGRDGDEIAVDGEVERDRCGQIGRCEPLRKPSRAERETVTAGLTRARDRQPALIGRRSRAGSACAVQDRPGRAALSYGTSRYSRLGT